MLLLSGCFPSSGPKPVKKVLIPAGTNDPALGLAVDASYDNRLDALVPGFKIVTVACTNSAMELFSFDILGDKWWVEDSSGKKIKAIIDLRRTAPKVWSNLSSKVKELIEYPLTLRIGETRTIDLFVPAKEDVTNFRSVLYYSIVRGQTFQIMSR